MTLSGFWGILSSVIRLLFLDVVDGGGGMEKDSQTTPQAQEGSGERRTFLTKMSSLAMAGGLVAGYGTFAGVAGRFLYPAHPTKKGWFFVSDLDSIKDGESIPYTTPAGATVTVKRKGRTGGVEDFIALSSTCPHLGCKVHWEPQNNRFFCPCHNGVFDPTGKAIAGPPGDAGLSLLKFNLKVENNLLFMEVPVETLTDSSEGSATEKTQFAGNPGHDDCLNPRKPEVA